MKKPMKMGLLVHARGEGRILRLFEKIASPRIYKIIMAILNIGFSRLLSRL